MIGRLHIFTGNVIFGPAPADVVSKGISVLLPSECAGRSMQRLAAAEGRPCTPAELAKELETLAQGPDFACGARSSAVVPFISLALVSLPAVQMPTLLELGLLFPKLLLLSGPPRLWLLQARAGRQFPPPPPWCRGRHRPPLPLTSRLVDGIPALGSLDSSWTWCWKLFHALAFSGPWASDTWHLSAFLPREEHPSSYHPPTSLFSDAASLRFLFLRRMLTFLHHGRSGATVERIALALALWARALLCSPAAVGASASPVLGCCLLGPL